MARYSASQVQTFTQCELKYRYRYVDKIPTAEFVETADTLLGSLVHATLEWLYNQVNLYKIPSKEDVVAYYHNLRAEKEKSVSENGGEIQNFHKDLSIDDFKQRGEIYLTRYYDKHAPFKDITVISTEKQISFQLADGINFQGFIDRLDKIGDTFVISDYKTNKTLPTEEKEQYIEQLTLYGIGIQQQYGKYAKDLKAKLYFLHFDIEDEWELTQECLDKVKEKYISIINEIEQKKVQYAMGSKKIFQANQSPLCSWCDYQSICPLFTAVNGDDEVEGELSEKSIQALVDEFIEVSEQISSLEKQKDELKSIFQKYVIKKDPNDFESNFLLSGTVGDVKITKTPKMTVVDKERFLSKVKELGLFEEYADISWQNVNALFLKSGKVTLSDFMGAVEEDVTFTVKSQKKKE